MNPLLLVVKHASAIQFHLAESSLVVLRLVHRVSLERCRRRVAAAAAQRLPVWRRRRERQPNNHESNEGTICSTDY